MGKISFTNHPDSKSLNVTFPTVFDNIEIDLYDDVEAITLTNIDTNVGMSTEVKDNVKNLSEVSTELGCFEVEMHTKSGGLYKKEIEVICPNTTLVFNKLKYDFELKRVDEECQEIVDDGTNLLSTTFVSTDTIRLQFRELESYDLLKDGFSFDDIVWETKKVVENDGTVEVQENEDNTLHLFIPSPINRPNQSGSGSRQPNPAIQYKSCCTIIGLKKEYDLSQDSKDLLRQEYIDFSTDWPPTRREIFLDNGAWNTGNHDHIAAQGTNRFQEIYDGVLDNYTTSCERAGINSDGLQVNSAYRNPQRNRAIGSVLINSNHTIGHAMDISILGQRTTQKWGFLRNAATSIQGVNAICEIGPRQVLCNNPNISHIHVAW